MPPPPFTDARAESGSDDEGAGRSFKHHVGREAQEKEALAETNFDLKLQLQAMTKERDEALGRRGKGRRATKDRFYDFEFGDDEDDDDGGEGERERQRLEEEVREAREEAGAARGRVRELERRVEKDSRDIVGMARENEGLKKEVLRERCVVDGMESEVQAARAKVESAFEQVEFVKEEAEAEARRVRLGVEGLEMQLRAVHEGREKEREATGRLAKESREWERKAVKAEAEVERFLREKELRMDEAACDAAGASRAEVVRLTAELTSLRLRHDALETEISTRKEAEEAVRAGVSPSEKECLSVPGFELYKRLVKKISGKGGTIVTGKGAVKKWRTIVLEEMNSSLLMLYWQIEKLESDRRDFIETHCKVLIERNKEKVVRSQDGKRLALEETNLPN